MISRKLSTFAGFGHAGNDQTKSGRPVLREPASACIMTPPQQVAHNEDRDHACRHEGQGGDDGAARKGAPCRIYVTTLVQPPPSAVPTPTTTPATAIQSPLPGTAGTAISPSRTRPFPGRDDHADDKEIAPRRVRRALRRQRSPLTMPPMPQYGHSAPAARRRRRRSGHRLPMQTKV